MALRRVSMDNRELSRSPRAGHLSKSGGFPTKRPLWKMNGARCVFRDTHETRMYGCGDRCEMSLCEWLKRGMLSAESRPNCFGVCVCVAAGRIYCVNRKRYCAHTCSKFILSLCSNLLYIRTFVLRIYRVRDFISKDSVQSTVILVSSKFTTE